MDACPANPDDFPFTGTLSRGSYCNKQCQYVKNYMSPLALFIIPMNCTLNNQTDTDQGRTCVEDDTYTDDLSIIHERGNCPQVATRGTDVDGISYPNVYKIQRSGCTGSSSLRLQPAITIARTDQGDIPVTQVHTSCSEPLYIDMIVPISPNGVSPVPCPVNTETPIPEDCGGVAYAYKIVGFVNEGGQSGISLDCDENAK